MHTRTLLAVLAATMVAGCDSSASREARSRASDSLARARQDSINRASPGYVIDSLLPIDEEIRRFRAAIGGPEVTGLGNASPSRESLFAHFVRAVERRDTTALRAMMISAREFIDLVYPASPYTRPPYRQSPRIRWGLMDLLSAQGLERLVSRRGGKPMHAIGMTCTDTPGREGENLIWNDCVARIRDANGGEHSERLFGGIIERDGRFKFLSYANQY